MIHVVDQLLPHRPVHQRPARHLAGAFVVGLTRLLEQGDLVDGHVGFAFGADAAGELRAAADRASLVVELP